MQDFFKPVSILIPHPVEILERKPLRFKHFLRRRQPKRRKHPVHKLIVGHTVLLSAADVIGLVPEILRNPVLADLGQETSGIFDGGPFEHTAHRDMEGSRIDDAENTGIQDSRLTQRDPMC